jgi:hypothetical protein
MMSSFRRQAHLAHSIPLTFLVSLPILLHHGEDSRHFASFVGCFAGFLCLSGDPTVVDCCWTRQLIDSAASVWQQESGCWQQ